MMTASGIRSVVAGQDAQIGSDTGCRDRLAEPATFIHEYPGGLCVGEAVPCLIDRVRPRIAKLISNPQPRRD